MIGFSEGSETFGVAFTLVLCGLLGATVWRLYSIGWGLRE